MMKNFSLYNHRNLNIWLLFLFAVLGCLPISSFAAVWGDETHEVYYGDVNEDGLSDILLRAKRQSVDVEIPYQISIPVSDKVDFSEDILLLGKLLGEHEIILNPDPSLVGDEVWNPGWSVENAQIINSDVDGDGLSDLQVVPASEGLEAFVVFQNASPDKISKAKKYSIELSEIDQEVYPRGGFSVGDPNALTEDAGLAVGSLPGHFQVTQDGKANYRVPLRHSPSATGFLDDLGLLYTGVNHNGELGVGWVVTPEKIIRRCKTNLHTDGYINGVNFNDSDKLCLNGVRLIAVEGEYWSNGAVYRALRDNYSQIKAYHEDGSPDPNLIEIRVSGGGVEQYYPQLFSESGRVVEWRLTKHIGRKNKSETHFRYSTQADTEGKIVGMPGCAVKAVGEVLLCRIEYNKTHTSESRIEFSYGAREDISEYFSGGTHRINSQRLENISETFFSSAGGLIKVRTFEFQYDYGEESKQSRIASIKECNSNGVCLKSTDFKWNSGVLSVGFSELQSNVDPVSYSQGRPYKNAIYDLVDVNADGKKDILWLYRDVDEFGWVIYHAGVNGFTKVANDSIKLFQAERSEEKSQRFLTGDFNGDGRSDFVWVGRNLNDFFRVVFLANSDGKGFTPQGYLVDSDIAVDDFGLEKHLVADVNGDGLSDLVWISQYQDAQTISVYHSTFSQSGEVLLPRVSKVSDNSYLPYLYKNQSFQVGDINGDSKSDLMWGFTAANRLVRVVYLSNANGSGFDKLSVELETGQIPNLESIKESEFALADLNGDGKDDLVFSYISGEELHIRLYIATAGGTNFSFVTEFVDQPNNSDMSQTLSSKSRVIDLNNDGRSDFLYSYSYNGFLGWKAYQTSLDGKDFVGSSGNLIASDTTNLEEDYLLGDMNADFRPDFLWVYLNASQKTGWSVFVAPEANLSAETYPDHIYQIEDGLGHKIVVDYSYLADPSLEGFFTKGDEKSYPFRSDAGLGFVVSNTYESNGVGGDFHKQYSYVGPVTHLRGLGFMGFGERVETNHSMQISKAESYFQEWPLNGKLYKKITKDTAGNDLGLEINHWRHHQLNFGSKSSYFVYLNDSLSILNQPGFNKPLSVQLKNVTYDFDYGLVKTEARRVASNVSTLAFDSIDEFDHTILIDIEKEYINEFEYEHNPETWRNGFLSEHALTVSVPGQPSSTVVDSFVPLDSDSYLYSVKTEYEGAGFQIQSEYSNHDEYGNATMVTVSGKDHDGQVLPARIMRFGNYSSAQYPGWMENVYEWNHTEFEYDLWLGLKTREIDPNGNILDAKYDDFGRLVLEKAADGVETIYQYKYCEPQNCPNHAVYYIIQSVGLGSQKLLPDKYKYYDLLGREIFTRSRDFAGADIYEALEYNQQGRLYRRSHPYYSGETVKWNEYIYDVLGRNTLEKKADGSTIEIDFSSHGIYAQQEIITHKIINPLGEAKLQTSVKISNSLGQVVETLDAMQIKTELGYDVWGNLSSSRVNGDVDTDVSIIFDAAGRKTQLADPDAGIITYSYDSFNNLREKIQGGGVDKISYQYDLLNRVKQRTDTVGGQASIVGEWVYDASQNGLGLLSSLEGDGYKETRFYDKFGRTVEKNVSLSSVEDKTFKYYYDQLGRQYLTVYPLSLSVEKTFTNSGFLKSIRALNDNENIWEALSSDRWGNIDSYKTKNGVVTTRQYDPFSGFLNATESSLLENGELLHSEHYVRDTSGNLVRRTDVLQDIYEEYLYDDLNRLKSAVSVGLSSGPRELSFHYDNLGNITYKTGYSDVGGYSYGENGAGPHAVTKVVREGQALIFGYDEKGNLINNAGHSVSYNASNLPVKIEHEQGETLFDYSPLDERFYQKNLITSDVNETFYFEGGKYQVVKAGGVTRYKVYVGDFLLHQTLFADNNGELSHLASLNQYILRDVLGSPAVLLNETGNELERNLFEPFGERRQGDWETASQDFTQQKAQQSLITTAEGFTGHENLDSSNLIHMNGRLYHPLLGRFASPDDYVQVPYMSQSYNRYSYVLNNPVSYTDPSGELVPIPALVTGVVLLYKSYNTYESAAGVVEDVGTLSDPNSDSVDQVVAAASLVSTVVSTPNSIKRGMKDLITKVRNAPESGQVNAPDAPKSSPDVVVTNIEKSGSDSGVDIGDSVANPIDVVNTGGSIRNINKVGGKRNCANCSIATDATLAGNPASALNSGLTNKQEVAAFFGRNFGSMTSLTRVHDQMVNAGNGARGVVFAVREGKPGHFFNVVNQNGTVRFLDGQTGKAFSSKDQNFIGYQLLKTN